MNATQAAIDYALANGIDISNVPGNGSGGNITKPDVEKYLETLNQE
ncbi:E3 binding domain-containing protein [Ignatzschineria indica]|nr:E3 binding domain-containing protein [Ignatzschineria indica]